MGNRFVTSFRLTALVIAASIVPANACETCTFFSRATDRTGAHRLIVAPDRRTSAAGDTPLVTVTIVNHGRKEMRVDTARILRHMTLHIASANGNARSQFDLPVDESRGNRLSPGSILTLEPVSLRTWGNGVRAPGSYRFALSLRSGRFERRVVRDRERDRPPTRDEDVNDFGATRATCTIFATS